MLYIYRDIYIHGGISLSNTALACLLDIQLLAALCIKLLFLKLIGR